MEGSLIKLKEILKNLKKSPGRTYSEKTINLRLEDIKVITGEFKLAQLKEKEEKKISMLRLEFRNIIKKIKEYLIESIKNPLETKPSEIGNTMAAFSLETVSKALPLFAGNFEELESFLITAELIIRLNSKLALDSFKRGINDNLKTAIFAARPKTLQDEVELALELENESKLTTNSVQYIQKQHRNNNGTRHNNSNFHNTRNNINNRNNYNFPNRRITTTTQTIIETTEILTTTLGITTISKIVEITNTIQTITETTQIRLQTTITTVIHLVAIMEPAGMTKIPIEVTITIEPTTIDVMYI